MLKTWSARRLLRPMERCSVATLYCLDTSVLIESWGRHYRPKGFPSFWDRVHHAIEDGVFIAPAIVLNELERKEDDLWQWTKEREQLFIPLTVDLQLAQEDIINRFSRLINQSNGKSMADPWVIALAKLRGCPVVTYERAGSLNNPRIPDVCMKMGIGCLRLDEVIDALGWTF